MPATFIATVTSALRRWCRVAGPRGNDRCLWVIAAPLPAREALQALRAAWDGLDDAIQAGALRILDSARDSPWCSDSSRRKRARAEGRNGLRIAGNTSFLTPGDWSTFMEYEHSRKGGGNMSNDFEKRLCVTCHSCGRVNAFSLFNGTVVTATDLVHCSHCRSVICRWGKLEDPEKSASARPDGALGEKGEHLAPPSPLPPSALDEKSQS